MGKKITMVCDVCGKELEPLDHFIRLNPSYLCKMSSGNERIFDETIEWYVCGDCLGEIGKRVAERNVEVSFEVKEEEQ